VETPASDPAKPVPWLNCILLLGILFILFGISLGPIHEGPLRVKHSPLLQTAHVIGLALFYYANDNDQHYPDGASSTEVFQKLLDGGYVTDPNLFYIPMPGKVPPKAGQKLKSENVSWDLTAPTVSNSYGGLPLLFMTGYKVSYVPGGAATPVIKPAPEYEAPGPPPTWFERTFENRSVNYEPSAGIAVFYMNNSVAFHPVAPDGTIPNFVSPGFKPDGITYHQLTPDGVLR